MSSRAIDDLRLELDRVRESLKDTDETIRKLTGRESLAENRFRSRDNFLGPPTKRQNVGGVGIWIAGRGFGGRPRDSNYIAPDSGDEDELMHKPSIQSSVVATPQDLKSRQDIIERQNSSEKDKARNRRMFGVLMGTLQQFRAEEKQKEQQEQKRKAVEQKLEEKQKEEKETLKKEKQQLFINRREKQMKMKQIENKIELVQLHEEWEEQTRTLMNFIRSNSKPHIFYLPKSHTDASLMKHEQSNTALEAIINERKQLLRDEVEGNIESESQDKQDKEGKEEEGGGGERSHNNRGRCVRGRHKEEGDKMEVSDLEDDTGVNVDYGASGDEGDVGAGGVRSAKDREEMNRRRRRTASSHYSNKDNTERHSSNIKEKNRSRRHRCQSSNQNRNRKEHKRSISEIIHDKENDDNDEVNNKQIQSNEDVMEMPKDNNRDIQDNITHDEKLFEPKEIPDKTEVQGNQSTEQQENQSIDDDEEEDDDDDGNNATNNIQ